MSLFNKVDVNGCDYTMEVLAHHFNTDIQWVHTSTSLNDEHCKYDMDWTSNSYQYAVENKDRRINWKTKEPQYYSTYPTVMFNIDKYNYLMDLYHTTGKIPLYTADYADGVVVFDLRTFPENCKEIWKEEREIQKTSVMGGEKIKQDRMMIPKEYGQFFPKQ